ncbi:MAG: lytic transglycosylase domain-containing protein [Alphaproteobacteria bacterium]
MANFARVLTILAFAAALSLAPLQDSSAATAQPKKVVKKATTQKATKTAPRKILRKPPPRKQKVQSRPADDDWQKAAVLLKSSGDPVARKLLTWIYVTETNLPIEAHSLITFVETNPDWPRQSAFRRKIETGIGAELSAAEAEKWCLAHPPTSYDGARGCISALAKGGKQAEARKILDDWWYEAELNKNQTAAMVAGYGAYFKPGAQAARLNHLVWLGRYEEADAMLPFVDANSRALAEVRMALGKMSKNADKLLQGLSPQALNSEGVMFERLRWRRRKNMDSGALELIGQMPKTQTHPVQWWGELSVMSRRAIERRNYAAALSIAAKHDLKDGLEFSQAEWLIGWLNLRLKKPVEAYNHFDVMYRSVGTAISRSRAAYWAARASEMLPDQARADRWHQVAAQYPSTYYGQLSYEKAYGTPKPGTFNDQPLPPGAWEKFNATDNVKALRLLQQLGLKHFTEPFLVRIIDLAQTEHDFMMAARLARETGSLYYAVQANKEIQQRLGLFLFEEGYPQTRLPAQTPEKALVHAIIHRESMFNTHALSPAGARGLMQLMPSTAKMTAKREGETYNIDKLTADPSFNLLIGSAYLRGLLHDYNGFYPMAIAAYNAGPGNVKEWNGIFGDPRTNGMDLVDWVEHIPIYETRNYIQRVMESYYIYRMRFGETPHTIYHFMPRR